MRPRSSAVNVQDKSGVLFRCFLFNYEQQSTSDRKMGRDTEGCLPFKTVVGADTIWRHVEDDL